MKRSVLPEPGKRSWLYVAIIVLEAAAGAVILVFALPFGDSLQLGNVQGKGSPTWFWLVQGSPWRAATIASAAVVGLLALEFTRRKLRRRWRKELDSWS